MELKERIRSLFPQETAIPHQFRLGEAIEQGEFLLDGELRQWTGPMQEVWSPVCTRSASGLSPKRLGRYPLLTRRESMQALEAALRAYDKGRGAWPTMSVAERIHHVQEFAYRMEEKKDEVVRLLMWEIGKSHQDSVREFDRTLCYINDTINALKDLDRNSSRFVIEQGIIGQIRRSPLGVVLCMGPFNYPLNETFTTLIPALMMGNAVIFKPPKLGVLLHRPLLEAFRDSFPKGVINTIYGEGKEIVSPLMASGKIDVLAFIGSSRVADILKKQHPQPHRLRSVLGLEAKNPAVILEDADLDLAVSECLLGTLSYNGQRCTALKILFVHRKVVDEFLARFTTELRRLKFGMPWEENVALTPLPEDGKTAYLTGLIEDAVKQGAAIINEGGGEVCATFFYPAALYPAAPGMRIYQEEQFGPVIPVLAFDDIETPLQYIIDSNYGQQVSLFGQNPDTLGKLIDPLANQVCRINLNSQCQRGPDTFPFSGRKNSAEGTLSVSDALRVFSIRSLVAAREKPVNRELIGKIVRERKSNFLSTDFIL